MHDKENKKRTMAIKKTTKTHERNVKSKGSHARSAGADVKALNGNHQAVIAHITISRQ